MEEKLDINKIAVIDLDSLSFTIGHPNKVLDEFGVPKRTEDNSKFIYEDKTEEELAQSADYMMNTLLDNGGFTHYIAYIKGKDTIKYKKEIDPTYKADRNKETPKWWNFVKNDLITRWKAIEVNNIEVDDAVNITRLLLPDSYICAIDSDLLGLEGTHFNWRKNEWVTTTKDEAEYKFWSDMVTGTHNNTKGLPGKGKKAAEAIIYECNESGLRYSSLVFDRYITHFGEQLGIEEFYKNYKLLKILDNHPDFEKSDIINNLVGKIHLIKKEEAF